MSVPGLLTAHTAGEQTPKRPRSLADAAPVIKKFMDVAEGDINFNAIAMAPFQ